MAGQHKESRVLHLDEEQRQGELPDCDGCRAGRGRGTRGLWGGGMEEGAHGK